MRSVIFIYNIDICHPECLFQYWSNLINFWINVLLSVWIWIMYIPPSNIWRSFISIIFLWVFSGRSICIFQQRYGREVQRVSCALWILKGPPNGSSFRPWPSADDSWPLCIGPKNNWELKGLDSDENIHIWPWWFVYPNKLTCMLLEIWLILVFRITLTRCLRRAWKRFEALNKKVEGEVGGG